jgi:hypothetical protein
MYNRLPNRSRRELEPMISMGAMQVEVSGLKPKDTLRGSFQPPISGAAIEADGVIVWANENRQGA